VFAWLYGQVWWPVRNWASGIISSMVSNRKAVPACANPHLAETYVRQVAGAYKPDLFGGALDYSYEGRIIQFYLDAGRLDMLPSLDCDDVAYYAWALMYGCCTNPAVVILFDDGPKALHHAVFAFDWGGSSWTLDVNGLRVRDGQSVADLFNHIYPEANYQREVWSKTYPFDNPRTV
jgi:hypothetical protein